MLSDLQVQQAQKYQKQQEQWSGLGECNSGNQRTSSTSGRAKERSLIVVALIDQVAGVTGLALEVYARKYHLIANQHYIQPIDDSVDQTFEWYVGNKA